MSGGGLPVAGVRCRMSGVGCPGSEAQSGKPDLGNLSSEAKILWPADLLWMQFLSEHSLSANPLCMQIPDRRLEIRAGFDRGTVDRRLDTLAEKVRALEAFRGYIRSRLDTIQNDSSVQAALDVIETQLSYVLEHIRSTPSSSSAHPSPPLRGSRSPSDATPAPSAPSA
ncbi:uncharacterized protein B0H18DRAFT_1128735 [Fomitopsis serialis]|uniref:uncharacterized protein n=1 Tax=Fomitopsis serialis TaxID=139415 RepID=UPI0020082D5E|nr:uncharacterized protein B0H18DRAFT_1128735 [Neoantrodia serialis]KAH9911399.1 hypothetical protein B0H18DRAFT_1128735 [Neoantrodia serialis]